MVRVRAKVRLRVRVRARVRPGRLGLVASEPRVHLCRHGGERGLWRVGGKGEGWG